MAYITSERVKEIRNAIKLLCPSKDGWKVSVIREHHSVVDVTILEAPFELRNDPEQSYEQTNPYYLAERVNIPSRDILSKISKVANEGNYDRSDVQSDYFDVGFYFRLSWERWDEPFKVNEPKF